MRESDDDTIRRDLIFVDSKITCRSRGDILQPLESGIIKWSDMRSDLFDLCSDAVVGRPLPTDITLYKNAGGASSGSLRRSAPDGSRQLI